MIRKIFSVALVCALTFTLAACGNKYRIEREGMPDELKARLENQIVAGEALLAEATEDMDKVNALHEIAFANEQLGYFDEAIPLYKQILGLYPTHYPALNNLGVIYEEVGEYETAAKYYGQLLEANPTETKILEDAIRALVAAGHYDDAQTNLESFIRYNQDSASEIQSFISNQFEFIRQARLKTQQ
ncbi:MAG: tetratricopeptide repeat protein [Candidatus Peribacteraceae bacterium]|nr:tetratricopeptide repeat protein [Candidatus Peribacteraceae bacterium]